MAPIHIITKTTAGLDDDPTTTEVVAAFSDKKAAIKENKRLADEEVKELKSDLEKNAVRSVDNKKGESIELRPAEGFEEAFGSVTFQVHAVEVDAAASQSSAKAPASKAKTSKAKAVKADTEEEDDEEMEDADDKKPAKKAAAKGKKPAAKMTKSEKIDAVGDDDMPEGIENCLAGLKLLFTGTFNSMDRTTAEATAKHYGAKTISKLADTDYIVLGTRAGQKKLDEIEEKGLATITEQEFLDMLKTGIPADKKQQLEADGRGDGPATKKRKQ